ncbi:ANTAR domain-containing protein [Streptomyces monticola]|uniref:ANTAR domain-containing protein n=1 Tax=Streptomyces monticola TaxID=2666263 RepID=A0ABW2JSS9_9ACTN
MPRRVGTREERWALKADVVWGNVGLAPAIVMLRAENDTLRRALAGHVLIDQARGMVMVLAPCSSERAWGLLVDISQHCNVKLRDVAAALVATAEGEPLPEQMRRELRRALRRLHTADRA